jgi:hypothetical protein
MANTYTWYDFPEIGDTNYYTLAKQAIDAVVNNCDAMDVQVTANTAAIAALGAASAVGVSADDTTPGNLTQKLSGADGITLTELDGGGDETLQISGGKVMVSSNDSTANYLVSKLSAGDGISITASNDGANESIVVASTGVPKDYITGLQISNGAVDALNDIDIAAGVCRDEDDSYEMELAAGITIQLDQAFDGTGNKGNLASNALAANTNYHIFLIRKDSDGTIKGAADTSPTCANIYSGFTAKRWIGVVRTDATPEILPFWMHPFGDRIFFKDKILISADITKSSSWTTTDVSGVVPIKADRIVGLFPLTVCANSSVNVSFNFGQSSGFGTGKGWGVSADYDPGDDQLDMYYFYRIGDVMGFWPLNGNNLHWGQDSAAQYYNFDLYFKALEIKR